MIKLKVYGTKISKYWYKLFINIKPEQVSSLKQEESKGSFEYKEIWEQQVKEPFINIRQSIKIEKGIF